MGDDGGVGLSVGAMSAGPVGADRAVRRMRRSALVVASSLLLAACGGAEEQAPAAPAPVEQPAPPPSPVERPVEPPPPPPPPPEPTVERLIRTVPGSLQDPDRPLYNAYFQRFESLRSNVVGQTLEVTEALELHRIDVWFHAPSVALPGFRDVYYDGIDWRLVEQFVQNGIPIDDLDIALSVVLYRSPDPDAFPTLRRRTQGFGSGVALREREVIVIDRLEVVSDQRLVGAINAGGSVSQLELTEPVVMEPGRWVLALRIDRDETKVDILDLPIRGWETGSLDDVLIAADQVCEYTPAEDPTPGFGFYWFDEVVNNGQRQQHFIPGFAKIPRCYVEGRADTPMGTGDIALDLWGFPVD